MIPAILAAPVVEGLIGQVVGLLSPHSSSAPPPPPFGPALTQATAAGSSVSSSPLASSGSLTSNQWNQMNGTDVQTWMTSLAGKYVHATDVSGRTVSGIVNGFQHMGNTLALNIGGHLVSLSQLDQVRWSPGASLN